MASALSTLLCLRGRDWKKDPDVLRAATRIEEAPFPTTAEDLLALRDALIVLDRDRLGDRDWYRLGGDALLKSQKADGSWDDLETTARAVIFIGAQPRPIHLPDSR